MAFTPSWIGLLHGFVPRDFSNGCFDPLGRRKVRADMRLSAEEEPKNAWLTGSCPQKRNTRRSMCLWGGGGQPSQEKREASILGKGEWLRGKLGSL